MSGGGLFDPLGVDRVEPEQSSSRVSAPVIVATVCIAVTLVLIGVAWLRDDGDRGEPRAVGPITRIDAPPKPVAPAPLPGATPGPTAAGPGARPPALPPLGADQEVEIQNGVRIVRPRRDYAVSPSQPLTVPARPAGTP